MNGTAKTDAPLTTKARNKIRALSRPVAMRPAWLDVAMAPIAKKT